MFKIKGTKSQGCSYCEKCKLVNVNIEACRIIDDFGFNFYLESFGENLELDKLKKLVLFEEID